LINEIKIQYMITRNIAKGKSMLLAAAVIALLNALL
jgi:hypothetical protein